jgi:molybdopterin synthase catalytic subunit
MLVRRPIDGQALVARVGGAAAGANVLFLGTTRGVTDGVETLRLEYEAHEPLAEAMLAALRDEAITRHGLVGCAIEHRLGVVPVGETSVAIAVSAVHRREAFAAAAWLMERIKADVPIWKCEEGRDGTRAWVHPDAAAGGAA